ncbi:MAG: FtsW/RodA/SpoVE family cell cycle protein [Cryomorphaceae bacterium]|jgi:cell division protein FtsW|nr:FtsW/RodA/SpoVE family cell cycle protein [Cryomorphaceae bacterium]
MEDQGFSKYFQGSTQVWVSLILLSLFSLLPVYSGGGALSYFAYVVLSWGLAFAVHRTPYRFFGSLAGLLMVVSIALLALTLAQGRTIGGANASRWLNIFGISFQTSAMANVVLIMFVARQLAKRKEEWTFWQSFRKVLWAIFLTVGLILPANFSTAALVFINASIVLALGGYPFRYLLGIAGIGAGFLALFVSAVLIAPDLMPNRVQTWKSRIETFSGGGSEDDTYQTTLAQTAIAEGGIFGQGPGGGLHKHFLPQNNSDFVYALIVEEYGLVGGTVILAMYVWLLFSVVRVAKRSKDLFGKLLSLGIGYAIVLQAFINMAVATGLFPVTGQTLPLVSAGGTSLVITSFALAMVIAVSRGKGDGEQVDPELAEALANDWNDPTEPLTKA